METYAFEAEYVTFDQYTGQELAVEKVFKAYEGTLLSCDAAVAPYKNLTAEQAIAKRALVTTEEPIGTRTSRNCSVDPAGDVITNVQPDATYGTDGNGFVPDGESPDGDNNGGVPTETQFVVSNPDIFSPSLEWSAGKARIKNLASPTIDAGEHIYYFLAGQPPVGGLKTEYTYSPGDNESIMCVIATSSDPVSSNWNKKAYASITIGPTPTT